MLILKNLAKNAYDIYSLIVLMCHKEAIQQ
jgi:hypothetical protein